MARWLNGSMTQFYGVLAGDDDKQIGTFSGIAGKEKLSGTCTFENGDSGVWSWVKELGHWVIESSGH
jgi:hypothetical protein